MSHIVAVLGLGIIGSRCADQLSKHSFSVQSWNRTPQQREDSFSSAAEACHRAKFISLYLKDGIAVREVFHSIQSTLLPSQIVLNHSTIDLETTHWLADRCREIGCSFLDSPFTGSKVAAERGALVYYVGGEVKTLEKSKEVLRATSSEIKHLGPVGAATVIKLATNLISAATVQALSEALAITEAYGIDATVLTDAVASNACGSPLATMKLPLMAQGNYETHFSLENMLKDSKFALELAKNKEIQAPVTTATFNAMEKGCKKGNASLDFSALFKPYQKP